MKGRTGTLCLAIALAVGTAAAQQPSRTPNAADMYCSGVVTTERVARDAYLISGEESNYKITFAQRDLVYINLGSGKGTKVGDEFLVMRPVHEHLRQKWFTWQTSLLRAMGQTYADLGRIRVMHVDAKAATAEVVYACDYLQRGDLIQPFVDRPAPPYKEAATFDRFAPASGRKTAMVVTTKGFGQVVGRHDIVYVNLGSGQGVKVGDYFRVFRYQGAHAEVAPQTYGMAYKLYGFGSTPQAYKWDDLPREILGEGIVVRVGPNSSTVAITLSSRAIYAGDYVEIE